MASTAFQCRQCTVAEAILASTTHENRSTQSPDEDQHTSSCLSDSHAFWSALSHLMRTSIHFLAYQTAMQVGHQASYWTFGRPPE